MLASTILASSLAVTPPAPPPTREWYGYYNLTLDSAALGVLALARTPRSVSAQTNLAITSLFIYGFGGPLIHLAHGRAGTAFGSLGIRVGAPLAAAAVGCVGTVAVAPGATACAIGAFGGAVVGVAGAVLLDAALLAYTEPAAVRVAPTASFTRDRAIVGLHVIF